jgi:hypothetical protein
VPLMRFLTDLEVPLPKAYQATAEFVLNLNLRQAFEADEVDRSYLNNLLEEAQVLRVELDAASLEYSLRQTLEGLAERFRDHVSELGVLQSLNEMLDLAADLPFEVNLWKVQNLYYEQLHSIYPFWRDRASRGETEAVDWVEQFAALGEKLNIYVD